MAGQLPSGVVTFLLTDVVDSTALWDAQPTAMAKALERHDAIIGEAVAASGGTMVKSKGEGDATFSVFGRASDGVAAAVRAQAALRAEAWSTRNRLRVRMAIVTGEANEREGDYFGPTVNRAARLRALADGDEVLVGESTAALVRDALPAGFALRELGERELRGMSRPERVFLVANGSSAESPSSDDWRVPLSSALTADGLQRLIGRDLELEAIDQAWSDPKRRLVLIAGEPGIGKTRMVAEVAQKRADGVVLFGHSDEGLGAPYQPWVEALDALVSAAPISVLHDHVRERGPALLRIAPALGRRVPGLTPLLDDADADGRWQVFEAVVDLLSRVDTPRLLLVLDDLHWADKPSLLLLRHVVRSERAARVLILGTYRDTDLDRSHPLADALAELRQYDGVERLALDGLSGAEVEAFVAAAAGHALDEDGLALAQAVHAETAGNPFFLGQVLRHLSESGALERRDGQWVVTGPLVVPDGALEVIGRRLSRLSAATNRMLAVAAVVGAEWDMATLEQVGDAGSRGEQLDALDEALRHRIVLEVGAVGHYRFTHALMRQALYRELSSARRAHLHHTIGEVLEAAGNTPPARLAYHYAEAARRDDVSKAVHWLVVAGQAALADFAWEEATEHAERGLELLDLADPPDAGARVDLMTVLAAAASRTKLLAERRDPLIEALAAARALGDEQRIAEVLAIVPTVQPGTPDREYESLVGDVSELVRRIDVHLAARVVDAQGYYFAVAGDPHAGGRLVSEFLEHAGDKLSPAETALLVGRRATGIWALPFDLQRTVSGLEEAVAVVRAIGEPQRIISWVVYLAAAKLIGGDRDGCDAALGEFPQSAVRSLLAFNRSVINQLKLAVAAVDGRFDDADKIAQEQVDTAPNAEMARMTWAAQGLFLMWERGDLEPVARALEANLDSLPTGIPRPALAALQAALGQDEKARALLARLSEEGWRRLRFDFFRRGSVALAVHAVADLADAALAETLLPVVEPYTGELLTTASGQVYGAADRSIAMLLAVVGRHDEAVARFEAAIDFEEGMRSPTCLARTKVWFARCLLQRDAPGDRARAQQLASEALAVAEELGMADVAMRARSLA